MDNLDGLLRVVVGIVGITIILSINYLYRYLKNRKEIKFVGKRDKIQKDKEKLNELRREGILTEDEFEVKTKLLNNELKRIEINYWLVKDETVNKIRKSYKQGLLSEEEKSQKIDLIKEKLKQKLKETQKTDRITLKEINKFNS